MAIIAALIMFPALDSLSYSSTNTSGIHTSDHGVRGIVKTNSDFHYKGISNGISPTSQTKKIHKTESAETPFVPVKNFRASDTNLSVNPQQPLCGQKNERYRYNADLPNVTCLQCSVSSIIILCICYCEKQTFS